MSEATIIAVVILFGVFSLMGATLLKYGIDDALKLWAGMGALTGVTFGAITSYYFTKQATEDQIAMLQSDVESKEAMLASYSIRQDSSTLYSQADYLDANALELTGWTYQQQLGFSNGSSWAATGSNSYWNGTNSIFPNANFPNNGNESWGNVNRGNLNWWQGLKNNESSVNY